MKYVYSPAPKDPVQRRSLNEKVLYLIESGKAADAGITDDDLFNAYTGEGGLHGLDRGDYKNYHAYSEAKKELENGQFFTPPDICRLVCEALKPSSTDLVADLTCGKGSFFNFLPVEANAYGCEIDEKAYKVAHHLFPAANLTLGDIRTYKPDVRFDLVVGNPPYNIKWYVEGEDRLSQLYYCIKAAELMKPLGILALVVPKSFLADDFVDQRMIRTMEEQFSFLGQIGLPDDAFSALGVERFETKLQLWQKKCKAPGWTPQKYTTSVLYSLSRYYDVEEAARTLYEKVLVLPKADLEKNKSHALLELARARATSKDFLYQTQKLLYQIKAHPATKDRYARCCEYLHQFYTQEKPPKMDIKEWDRIKLTEKKVLRYLENALSRQNQKPERDEIRLVKQDYHFVHKAYSTKMRRLMTQAMREPTPIYDAVLNRDPEDFPGYERLLRRKRREYEDQSRRFADMEEDPAIAIWLERFTLWDAENEENVRLNDMQRHDVNLMLQKRYGMLQWEQGSGKTLAAIAIGTYRMLFQNIHSTWVISTAFSIRNNWDVVLKNYGLPYVFVERLKDLEKIQRGNFVIMTLNKMGKYKRQVKRWLKQHGQKVQLVLDESDEISNPDTARAKAALSCFRRCRTKLETTGTSTRNNISEFAPQLELLYNNSINMISWCYYVYHYEKGDSEPSGGTNPMYGRPIPAYKAGYRLFSKSHLPEKPTVFGIGERTQDIYNADELNDILAKTVITRTFEEVTGKEIRRIHQIPMSFSAEERAVYQIVMKKFGKIQWDYFSSTGSSRKDAMLRLMQQITLMLRVGAAPNTLKEYTGDTPVKIMSVVEMAAQWENEYIVIGVRHIEVLNKYAEAIREFLPDRPLFTVTGSTTTFAQRRKLRKTLKASGNGILLCTQQSLPSSVNFEFVNKILIPELHFNNAAMSQFYMRFIRYTSTHYKDIYFLTYAGSLESNLMQMVLAKEKINLFMKGEDTDLDEIYEKFGVDFDLFALLMRREEDENGRFQIRWGEQKIA